MGVTLDGVLVGCHRVVVRLRADIVGQQLRIGGARERRGSLMTGAGAAA